MPRLAERLSTGAPDGSKPDRSQVPQQVNGRWGRSRMNVLVNIPTFKRLPMGAKTGAKTGAKKASRKVATGSKTRAAAKAGKTAKKVTKRRAKA